MNYQPLHHKYRPQTFADLVGQEAIAATLTQAIQQQRIAPAYLFTGARGTGKTSSARILAKSLNCLKQNKPTEKPCGQCEVCRAIANSNALDVIEIDAASNTGVDNIRELIERAQFAPVQCRYKVYVIDEVHMLSNAAFNALLKTLEEPPDRVVFVLATTDPQRVLPTIISRCQRFDFRRIPLEAMAKHLRQIANQETIAITDDAITLVAQISQGGLRDAESLLDQLSLSVGEVTVENVWDLVGSVPERDLMGLLEAIAADNPETLLDSTRRLMERGREPLIVLQNLASFYRDLLIAKTAPARGDLVAMTPPTWAQLCEFAHNLDITAILAGQQHLRSAEVQLKGSTQPRLWLEVTLMGLLPSAISYPVASSELSGGLPRPGQAESALKATASRSTAPRATTPSIADPRVKENPVAPMAAQPTPTTNPLPPETQQRLETEQKTEGEYKSQTNHRIQTEHQSEIDQQPEPEAVEAGTKTEQESAPPATELSQIWQQIIAHLHPLSKALLNEHGQLLGFDGQEVRIGISSDKLVKIAQGKIKDIEKAFGDVFNQKVRISLEVAAPGTGKGPANPQSAGKPPQSTEPRPGNVDMPGNVPPRQPGRSDRSSSDRPPNVTTNPAGSVRPNAGNQSSTSPESPPSVSRGKADAKPTPTSHSPVNSWEEDTAAKAARQLADFFGGKVVDLTDEDGSAAPSEDGSVASVADPKQLPVDSWSIASTAIANVDVEAEDADDEDTDEEDVDVPF